MATVVKLKNTKGRIILTYTSKHTWVYHHSRLTWGSYVGFGPPGFKVPDGTYEITSMWSDAPGSHLNDGDELTKVVLKKVRGL